MNLLFRLFFTLLAGFFRSSVPAFGPCRTPFRCYPTDLDLFMHMNNGEYFSLMDLGRTDMMIRSGMMRKIHQNNWYPVVVAETARFHKSLKVFQRFEIESKVIGWDDKAILIGQKFLRGNTLVCEAVVRARFLKKSGGSVYPDDLLKLASISGPSPELEPWVAAWNAQQAL